MKNEGYHRVVTIVVFAIGLVVCVALFGLSAAAQQRATVSTTPVRVQKAPSVPVLKVTTTRETPSAQLTGRRQHKPTATTSAEKVKLLQTQGGANLGSGGDVPITSVTLSPRRTYVMDKAMLGFNYAYGVSTISDRAVFSEERAGRRGVAVLHLKVAKGERYLVDFSVGPHGSGDVEYTVKFAEGSQQFSGSEPMHLLFVLEAQSSGWAWLELGANADYVFHGVEATHMD